MLAGILNHSADFVGGVLSNQALDLALNLVLDSLTPENDPDDADNDQQ